MDFAVWSSFVRKFVDETMEVTYERKYLVSDQDTIHVLKSVNVLVGLSSIKCAWDVKYIVRGTHQQ
jgi:hypothetical protein